jgi:hypothetical protein
MPAYSAQILSRPHCGNDDTRPSYSKKPLERHYDGILDEPSGAAASGFNPDCST